MVVSLVMDMTVVSIVHLRTIHDRCVRTVKNKGHDDRVLNIVSLVMDKTVVSLTFTTKKM